MLFRSIDTTTQPDFTNLYARKNENKNGPPHSTPLPVVVSMSSPIGCPVSVDHNYRFAKQPPKNPKPKTTKEEIRLEHEMRIEHRETSD